MHTASVLEMQPWGSPEMAHKYLFPPYSQLTFCLFCMVSLGVEIGCPSKCYSLNCWCDWTRRNPKSLPKDPTSPPWLKQQPVEFPGSLTPPMLSVGRLSHVLGRQSSQDRKSDLAECKSLGNRREKPRRNRCSKSDLQPSSQQTLL